MDIQVSAVTEPLIRNSFNLDLPAGMKHPKVDSKKQVLLLFLFEVQGFHIYIWYRQLSLWFLTFWDDPEKKTMKHHWHKNIQEPWLMIYPTVLFFSGIKNPCVWFISNPLKPSPNEGRRGTFKKKTWWDSHWFTFHLIEAYMGKIWRNPVRETQRIHSTGSDIWWFHCENCDLLWAQAPVFLNLQFGSFVWKM